MVALSFLIEFTMRSSLFFCDFPFHSYMKMRHKLHFDAEAPVSGKFGFSSLGHFWKFEMIFCDRLAYCFQSLVVRIVRRQMVTMLL